MGRLTKTYSDGTHGVADHLPCGENSYEYKRLLLDTLGKYEDLEEQGRLLRLPCKLGDTIYAIIPSFSEMRYIIVDYEVVYYTCNSSGEQYLSCVRRNNEERYSYGISVKDIGNTVFLTREEAEDKLKELEENNGR